MNQEDAYNEVTNYISDLTYCESYYVNTLNFEWRIYAAERLLDLIASDPDTDPLIIAKSFRARLEDYASAHEFAQSMFDTFWDAINDIIECYLY